jgi:Rrf2 family transcriptional regulator, iron-sulfur cluster assembly transcription factor
MKLSHASSYALHALTYLAGQKADLLVTSHAIAKDRKIPLQFLTKVLHPLVSVRTLFSLKGPNGGYRLAKSAAEISLLEILEAVDGPMRGQSAMSEANNGELNSKLEAICKRTTDDIRTSLGKVKLSDLASLKK